MKKFLFIASITALLFSGCAEDSLMEREMFSGQEKETVPVALNVTLSYPQEARAAAAGQTRIYAEDAATSHVVQTVTAEEGNVTLTLVPGVYNLYAESLAEGNETDGYLTAKALNVAIGKERNNLPLQFERTRYSAGLKLLTVYFRGARSNYYKDKFFVVYNNGNQAEPIANLAIAEGCFVNLDSYDNLNPDVRPGAMGIHALYKIPSNVTRMLQPGEKLVLCDQAQNHSTAASNSVNLSGADYEWYDNHPLDVDNTLVPNLEKIYCYTATIWTPHSRGYRSYALARVPVDAAGFSAPAYDYTYSYDYTYFHPGIGQDTTIVLNHSDRKIPASWILDVVNCSKRDEFLFNPAPQKDAGYVSLINETTYGVAMKRDYLGVIGGKKRYKDTGNSTNDFRMNLPVRNAFLND